MKGLSKAILAILVVAACGREGAITAPEAPNAVPLAPGVLALGVDSTTGASIETNRDDYLPGEVVHLVGRGWAPGETVNLHMTENPDTHADVDTNVVADGAGGFSIHYYDVQTHDIGVTFTLTATGQTSNSVAVAVFTDGAWNVTVSTFSPASPAPSALFDVSGSIAITGTGANTWRATEWWIDAGTKTCVNITDVTQSPPATLAFSLTGLTAPASSGAHTLHIQLWEADDCIDPPGPVNPKLGGEKDFAFNVSSPPVNGAPVVNAGGPYTVEEGSSVTLSGATATDPENDALTYKWTVNTAGNIDAGGVCTFLPSDAVLNPSVSCTDDSDNAPGGKFTLTLEVKDATHTTTASADLDVTNALPAVLATGGTGSEGSAINITSSFTDAGSNDTHTILWSYVTSPSGTGTCLFADAAALNTTVTCTDNGVYTLTQTITDDDGGVGSANATLTVNNVAPSVQATGGSGDEGAAINISGSFTDQGSNDTHTKLWSYTAGAGVDAGATCSFGNAANLATTVTCTDDGTYTLTLTVTDDDNGVGSANATLTVANVAPTVTITSPTVGQLFSLLNGAVPVTATYTDPGSNDTHTCQLELDGALDAVVSYFAVSGGTCSGSILPPEAGVYTLTVRVKDDDNGIGSASVMIVVYDPSAGFVTGGGWIQSAAGAYKPDLTLSGKATFGFVSKYKKGATIPEGNTEFQFHAGGMNFSSNTYQFLIVNQAGTNAQFKGTGTINGAGSYTFMIWATDGGNTGDTFRIQITDDNNANAIVYDNGVEQLITGSIVIHTGGKK